MKLIETLRKANEDYNLPLVFHLGDLYSHQLDSSGKNMFNQMKQQQFNNNFNPLEFKSRIGMVIRNFTDCEIQPEDLIHIDTNRLQKEALAIQNVINLTDDNAFQQVLSNRLSYLNSIL